MTMEAIHPKDAMAHAIFLTLEEMVVSGLITAEAEQRIFDRTDELYATLMSGDVVNLDKINGRIQVVSVEKRAAPLVLDGSN